MSFDENLFHMPVRKSKQEGIQIWHFYWSFSSDSMAVKGLIWHTRRGKKEKLT